MLPLYFVTMWIIYVMHLPIIYNLPSWILEQGQYYHPHYSSSSPCPFFPQDQATAWFFLLVVVLINQQWPLLFSFFVCVYSWVQLFQVNKITFPLLSPINYHYNPLCFCHFEYMAALTSNEGPCDRLGLFSRPQSTHSCGSQCIY